MGYNDHMEEDDGFTDFLKELIGSERLEGAAAGIAKRALDKGTDLLSPKQRFVFERDVIREYSKEGCSRCGSNIPWSEMFASLDNDGLCSHCWHSFEKIKHE